MLWHVKLKTFFMIIVGWIITKMVMYVSLKKAKYYYYNETRWENTNTVGDFSGKFYFLTGVTLKFYLKSNSTPKNNLFSTISRKYLVKKSKNLE